MKFTKLALSTGLALTSFLSQAQVDIQVNAEGWDGQSFKVYGFTNGNYSPYEDGMVENGVYSFQSEASEVPQFLLVTTDLGRNARTNFLVFAQNEKVELNFDTVPGGEFTWSVESGSYQGPMAKLMEIKDEVNTVLSGLSVEYNAAQEAGDEELVQEIVEQYEAAFEEKEDALVELAYEYPDFGTAIAIMEFPNVELAILENIYEKLDDSFAEKSELAIAMMNKITLMRATAIGQPMIDMEVPDADGNMIALSSMVKGKYTLIDFWASWCGPCRQENPNLVAEYNAYKDQGFNIIGVSLDQSKDPWLKAIEDDQLTWEHVSDLKGWSSEPAGAYGVRAIPANIIVDKDGIIVAKNLRGEDLGEWLEENF